MDPPALNEGTECDSCRRKRGGWPRRVGKAARACLKSLSPVKLLSRTRDLYVRTMLDCKGSGAQGFSAPEPVQLPAKVLPRREEENLRRLISLMESKRAQLVESGTGGAPIITYLPSPRPSLGALRSSSVHTTIAPIDEESPCYFPGSFKKKWATPLPRSGSCGDARL